MIFNTRLPAIVLLGMVCMSAAANAQSIAQTATRWGLVGSWRLDCKKPISNSNGDLAYVVRRGRLFHVRNFGGKRKDSSPVMAATIKSDGSIELLIKFDSLKQTRQFSMLKGADGRIRSLSNRDVDTDKYTVVKGKFVYNGKATPWQTRCR